MVVQQGVVADTNLSLAYRGYYTDDALRAVGVIPTATHKMPFRHGIITCVSDIYALNSTALRTSRTPNDPRARPTNP